MSIRPRVILSIALIAVFAPLIATAWLSAIWEQSASTLVIRFNEDRLDAPSKLFRTEVGTWLVTQDGVERVLAQKARSDDETFNLALLSLILDDVDLSVRLKAVAGEFDRGGGVVWRARDKNNYYVARYNPLENNFRVYKVENGKRTQFQSADIPGDTNWHTLRVTMIASRMTCYLDGKKYLEVDDATFPGPGTVGLWSKADAQTYFDDLTVSRP